MEKTWKITLASGTVIEGLEKSGNCFISDSPLPEELDGNLTGAVASADGEQELTWNNAELVHCASVDGRNWFALRELSDAEMSQLRLQAKVEYIAMMTDVDLEEV
jgi:hypothetical protein